MAMLFNPWLELAVKLKNHVDPYTVWSLQTKFRQFGGADGRLVLDFLVELDLPLGQQPTDWMLPWGSQPPVIPDIYRSPLPGASSASKHVTMRLPVVLKSGEDPVAAADAVLRLVFLQGVRRCQIGFPRAPLSGEFITAAVYPARGLADDADVSAVESAADSGASAPTRAERPPDVLLGILEDACPFGHAALLSEGGTRVWALWDQSTPLENPEPSPQGLGYGRERLQPKLNELLAKHRDTCGIDEQELYGDPDALQRRLRMRGSHAAAVTLLLAGREAVLPTHSTSTSSEDTDPDVPPRDAVDDAASHAPLVVVQFPREQINVAGARWMVVRALDGLRYLARASAQLAPDGHAPVPLVVNLSYGSVVGAHDGTALIETAMDELASAHEKMAIVLAAGNSHGVAHASDTDDDLARVPSGRHATRETLVPGDVTLLRLYVPPNKPIETYLEIWFDVCGVDPDQAQFVERGDVTILVTSPTGQALRVAAFPGIAFDNDVPDQTGVGLICFSRVAQSQRRSMALLVLAATQVSSTRLEVPSGTWLVEIQNTGKRSLKVQAWVERDLLPGASRSSQAARLLVSGEACAAELNDENTLNNIATGDLAFRVGALTALGCAKKPCVSSYSSAAARPEAGPEFSAVADESMTNPGIRVSGNTSGSVVRMNGTSVAAPQAARVLANALAAGCPLQQIRGEIGQAQGNARLGRIRV